ncbi:MAG: DUF2817 domain-containing protein [Thermoleophilia bacterium]
MIARGVAAALLATMLCAEASAAAPAGPIGRSAEGRPIPLRVRGDAQAARVTALVVGCTHGDECAGRAVVDRLARLPLPAGVRLLLVRNLNPDGSARRTRVNARGVDLNRNSSRGWRRSLPGTPTYGGPRPFSEPEARAVRDLILRERPALIVWYHQPLALVDVPFGRPARASWRYARRTGLPVRDLGGRPGSLSDWANGLRGAGPSFVVELPAGPLGAGAARRHARAVLAEAAGT